MNTLINLCKELKLYFSAETIDAACEQAKRQRQDYVEFLKELFTRECENKLEKRSRRRIKEAKFPLVKTLESFNFSRANNLPEAKIRSLAAESSYIKKAEPIIFLGEPGTGKTHLATALGYCAAQQGYSVRFITVSQLANMLIEAKSQHQLASLTKLYQGYHLLILDELGYVPLARTDAELLFNILSQRNEKYPVIITTNLPFGEWTSVFPDQRLCKALIDRLVHHAHIIETGANSIRFEQTLASLKINN